MRVRDRFDDPQRALAFALLGLAVAVLAYEEVIGALPGEKALERSVYKPYIAHSDAYREVLAFFGLLGTSVIVAATVVVLGWLVVRRHGRSAGLFVLVAGLAVPLNACIKLAVGTTPAWDQLHHHAANFPSGHVVYATVIYGAVAWAMWTRSRDVSAVLIALTALMGPARVLSGAHLVSDVIAAYALGGAWLIAAHRLTMDAGRPLRLHGRARARR